MKKSRFLFLALALGSCEFLLPALRGAEVVAWGSSGSSQSTVPANATFVTGITAGESHSVAWRTNGTVVAWGNNTYGQLNVPASATNIVAVAAGYFHNVALRGNGTIVGWGNNYYGQRAVPAGLTNAVAVAAGGYHSLALREDGSLIAWGRNDLGQASVPGGLSNIVAIAAGLKYNLVLRANGTVAMWGSWSTIPAGLSNVVAVAAPANQAIALKSNGTVVAWDNAGLRSVPVGLTNVVAIAGGEEHNMALRSNGTVVAWGSNTYGQQAVPVTLGNAVGIAAGSRHSLALTGTSPGILAPQLVGPRILIGTVDRPFYHRVLAKNWPSGYGASVLPPGLYLESSTGIISGIPSQSGTFWVTISATNSLGAHQLDLRIVINLPLPGLSDALRWAGIGTGFDYEVDMENGGKALSTGLLPPGLSFDPAQERISGMPLQLGDFPVSVLTSNSYGVANSRMAIRVSPVSAWGSNLEEQTAVPAGLSNVVAIAAGFDFSLALRANGSLAAWGANYLGQTNIPAGLNDVVAIAAGNYHSLALRANGTVVGWGANSDGATNSPPGLSNVVAVAAGNGQSLALRGDGSVVGWGYNNLGQANVPPGLSNVIAISACETHSVALRADGTVAAWGLSYLEATNPPPTFTNVIAIAAGPSHILYLRADGTVSVWPDTLTQVPAGLSNVVAIAADYQDLAMRRDGSIVCWSPWHREPAPAGLSNVLAVASGGWHNLAITGLPAGLAAPELVGPGILVGTVGQRFYHKLIAANGPTVYTASGLPAGLMIESSTGFITGQPTEAGTFIVTITAANDFGSTQRTMRLVVNLPLPGAVGGVVRATLGNWFEHHVSTVNGPTLVSASMPAGFSMDAASWTLSGTPMQVGDFDVTLVTSNAYGTASSQLRITVCPLLAWGENYSGQTNIPAVSGEINSIAAGHYHCLAVRSYGTVLAWGANDHGQTNVPMGLSNVIAVAGGDEQSLAVRATGSIADWGGNPYGLTNVPRGLSNVVAVAAGYAHNLALRSDGTVVGSGYYGYGATNVPPDLTNAVAVACGWEHSLALRSDGTVAAWGYEFLGATKVPAGLTDVVAVAGGGKHSLALRSDGSVIAWGDNYSGQTNVPSGLNNVVAIAAGLSHNLVLRADGTVVAWGGGGYAYTNGPVGVSNVVAVAAGGYFNLVLLGNGSPRIVSQPWNRTVATGERVVLSAPAAGAPPLSYQWLRNGTNVPGATQASYVLNDVEPSTAGNYWLVVTNQLGTATSAAAYVNLPPAVTGFPAATVQNQAITFPAEKLVSVASDPDGDLLSLSSVNATSTNGGSVSLSSGSVTYTPQTGYIGPDRFTFMVSDGHGGTASGFVLVQVRPGNQASGNVLAPRVIPGGYEVDFAGIPGRSYTLQRAESVTGPWLTLGTVMVGSNGIGTWADTNAVPASAYYRTAYP